MSRRLFVAATLSAALAAPMATAQQTVAAEITRAGPVQITIHRHDFLTPQETAVLELIATNADARGLFLGPEGDFAALALAPRDGLLAAGGMDVQPTAQAVAQLPDAATARARALELCEAARRAGPACVVVLEVAPSR